MASTRSDIADDATGNGDQDRHVRHAGRHRLPAAAWNGDIPVGGTVTITSTVTVNNPDTGNHIMTGSAVSTAPGKNRPSGSADPACTPPSPMS